LHIFWQCQCFWWSCFLWLPWWKEILHKDQYGTESVKTVPNLNQGFVIPKLTMSNKYMHPIVT
jgi:hypothetical protein